MNIQLRQLIFSILISFYTLAGFNNHAKSTEFEFLKTQMKPKLIIFHADWCLPCKMVNKWMKEDIRIKNILSNYQVEYCNYDTDKEMMNKYNVTIIPTLIVVLNEEEKARRVGISTGVQGLTLFLEANKNIKE